MRIASGVIVVGLWLWLVLARGWFWRSTPVAGRRTPDGDYKVAVVVPARDEAEHIHATLRSLLSQDFAGDLRVILVDDSSGDGTGDIARSLERMDARLSVALGEPLPSGWTGKTWAVAQGLRHPYAAEADFVLLTDADILHGRGHVASLVCKAEEGGFDLVSEMVRLRTESFAERALIPAFVFFFQMLYPFRRVGDARKRIAAAAGGTMLVSREALERVDGVSRIRSALIDDVALAREVKRGGYRIWLGHSEEAESLRAYPGFEDVWQMIARTAYVQLRYSPWLLAGTCVGMLAIYVLPVLLAVSGLRGACRLGVTAWLLMAAAFQPTLRRYRRGSLWGVALPAISMFYLGATVASAIRFYRGRGGHWKSRTYPASG